MSEKAEMNVGRVFRSRNVWWVRSGTSPGSAPNYQEVKEPDAERIKARAEVTGFPVQIAYVNVGTYPDNYLSEVDILS